VAVPVDAPSMRSAAARGRFPADEPRLRLLRSDAMPPPSDRRARFPGIPAHLQRFVLSAAGVLAALCVSLAAVPAAHAEARNGKVIGIADGDTLTILDGRRQRHRIRLDGIDAPERTQAYGRRARESLAALAHGRLAVADCAKIDRYGRAVCRVTVDGVDVGLEQLRRGLAWHYAGGVSEAGNAGKPADVVRTRYARAEMRARSARAGLWSAPAPTPPWDYRRTARGG
jgi:endonuclease YncB( thermonuclease family)